MHRFVLRAGGVLDARVRERVEHHHLPHLGAINYQNNLRKHLFFEKGEK